MPLQAYFAAPREHGVGGELGAVVTDDHGWLAALGDQFVQLSHNPPPGDRCVGHRTQTLPGHVIDNIEHAEAPPRDQLVVHEITATALVWQGTDRRRRLGAASTDRKSVVEGKSVAVRVDLGGSRRTHTKKKNTE